MKNQNSAFRRRGFSIVLTLLFLTLTSGLVVAFLVQSQQQMIVSQYYSQNILVDMEVVSAADRVIGEIREKMRISSQILSQENNPTELRLRPLKPQQVAASSLFNFPLSVPDLFDQETEANWRQAEVKELENFVSVRWSKIGLNLEVIPERKGLVREIAHKKSNSKSLLLQGQVYDIGGLCDANVVPWGALISESDRKSKSYSYALNPEKINTLGSNQMNRMGEWLSGSGSKSGEALSTRMKNYHKAGFLTIDEEARGFLSREDLLDYLREFNMNSQAAEVIGTFSREINSPTVRPTLNGSTFSTFKAKDLYTFKYLEECDDEWMGTKPRKFNRDFSLLPAIKSSKPGASMMARRFPLRRLDLLEKSTGGVGVGSEIYRYFGLTRDSEDSPWVYAAGALDEFGNTKIYQLNDPAFIALDREPNFFELLQAGILAGSLGQNSKSNDLSTSGEMIFVQTPENEISTPYHVFKIGLNIIDQWDQDGYPTMLQVIGRKIIVPVPRPSDTISQEGQVMVLIGQEGVPILSEIHYFAYRPPSGTIVRTPLTTGGLNSFTQNALQDYLFSWFIPEFWAIENQVNSPTNSPTTFRFSATNGIIRLSTTDSAASPPIPAVAATSYNINYTLNPSHIVFSLNRSAVVSPKIADASVTSVLSTTPTTLNQNLSPAIPTGPANLNWYGIPSGACLAAERRLGSGTTDRSGVSFGLANNFTVTLSWSYLKKGRSGSSASDWQEMHPMAGLYYRNLAGTSTGANGTAPNQMVVGNNPYFTNPTVATAYSATTPAFTASVSTGDPRGSRVGWTNRFLETANYWPTPNTHPWFGIPSSWNMTTTVWGNPAGALFRPFYHFIAKSTQAMGLGAQLTFTGDIDYADNRITGVNPHSSIVPLLYYQDNDGIVRRADGNATYGVYPNRPDTDLSARPIILNRAFKNVAEIGYAYRDLPWKTVDFFSSNSGDRALLDLFTLEEEAEMIAGKIHFHSASREVLASLIEGSEIDPAIGSTISSGSGINSSAVAEGLYELKSKVENKSDLVTQLFTALPESSQLDTAIKWRRESVIRALIPSVQTRTWNLCLDLNCQVASLQKKAKGYGSRSRVWVSVAIDRYTGELIDQQVEWIQ